MKDRLLCNRCESLFNTWETPFSQNFFHPYHKDSSAELYYSTWMCKFCASVSWRVAEYMFRMQCLESYPTDIRLQIAAARGQMRNYLNGLSEGASPGVHHLIRLDLIEANLSDPPPGLQGFLFRSIAASIRGYGPAGYIFTKLGRLLLVTECGPAADGWFGTRVDPAGGVSSCQDVGCPGFVWDWMVQMAASCRSAIGGTSERQQAVIRRSLKDNISKLPLSETWKVWEKDGRFTDIGSA